LSKLVKGMCDYLHRLYAIVHLILNSNLLEGEKGISDLELCIGLLNATEETALINSNT